MNEPIFVHVRLGAFSIRSLALCRNYKEFVSPIDGVHSTHTHIYVCTLDWFNAYRIGWCCCFRFRFIARLAHIFLNTYACTQRVKQNAFKWISHYIHNIHVTMPSTIYLQYTRGRAYVREHTRYPNYRFYAECVFQQVVHYGRNTTIFHWFFLLFFVRSSRRQWKELKLLRKSNVIFANAKLN